MENKELTNEEKIDYLIELITEAENKIKVNK